MQTNTTHTRPHPQKLSLTTNHSSSCLETLDNESMDKNEEYNMETHEKRNIKNTLYLSALP